MNLSKKFDDYVIMGTSNAEKIALIVENINDTSFVMEITANSGDKIEIRKFESEVCDPEQYFAVCKTNSRATGLAHATIRSCNDVKRILDVKCLCINNGKNLCYVKLTNEEYEILRKKVSHHAPTFTCWECGRIFHHRPAPDGTCGEC